MSLLLMEKYCPNKNQGAMVFDPNVNNALSAMFYML